MASGRLRHATVLLVACSLIFLSFPIASADALTASWGGRVFEADRVTPRSGVVISLVDASRKELRSVPTRADGGFALEGAPGSYTLRVETEEGAFLSGEPVTLNAGVNKPMALALDRIDGKKDFGLGDEGVSRRTEWIIAGAVTVFALFVLFEITDDDGEPAASIN